MLKTSMITLSEFALTIRGEGDFTIKYIYFCLEQTANHVPV